MDFNANQKKPVEPIFGGGKKENNLSRKTNKTSFGKRLKIKDGLTMQVAISFFFFQKNKSSQFASSVRRCQSDRSQQLPTLILEVLLHFVPK